MQVVQACSDDTDAVLDIFNHYVEHSFASYFKTKVGAGFASRLFNLGKRARFLVAKDDSGQVTGFALLHPFHPGDACDRSGEVSYFLRPERRRQGIGSLLLAHLTEQARCLQIRTLLANISSRNEESLAFHARHGFEEVARLPAVGEKFGELFDVVYMMKRL